MLTLFHLLSEKRSTLKGKILFLVLRFIVRILMFPYTAFVLSFLAPHLSFIFLSMFREGMIMAFS